MKTAGQKEGAGLLERAAPIEPMPLGGWVAGMDFSVKPHGYPEVMADEPFRSALGKKARVLLVPDEPAYRLASDRELLLRALTTGKAAVGMTDTVTWINAGCRWATRSFAVAIDATGCPLLTDELRDELRKVVGSNG